MLSKPNLTNIASKKDQLIQTFSMMQYHLRKDSCRIISQKSPKLKKLKLIYNSNYKNKCIIFKSSFKFPNIKISITFEVYVSKPYNVEQLNRKNIIYLQMKKQELYVQIIEF